MDTKTYVLVSLSNEISGIAFLRRYDKFMP
jgi:hypothetical protein